MEAVPVVRFAQDAKPQVMRAADALITALLADEASPAVANETGPPEIKATEPIETQVVYADEPLAARSARNILHVIGHEVNPPSLSRLR